MTVTDMRFRAGVAEGDITPQGRCRLAREMDVVESEGIAGRLSARALAIGDGRTTLVILCLDLYGLGARYADELVRQIGQAASIRPEGVMVFCSRTRQAPVTAPIVGHDELDASYLETVIPTSVEVACEAVRSMQPASVGYGKALLPHLVWNQRLLTRNYKAVTAWLDVPANEVLQPEGPTDPDLPVLLVRDDRGRAMAAIWSIAADNRFPDTDQRVRPGLPGLVQAEMDERMGSHLPVLYVPGCGGDVSFARSLEDTSRAIADSLMAVQLEIPCDRQVALACLAERVILPVRDCDQFWSEPDIELKLPAQLDLFRREVQALQAEDLHGLPSEVKVLRIGDHALAALPGMPFAEFSRQVKQNSPTADLIVAANQGGEVGYVLTQRAFDHGGYEAWPSRSARLGRGAGEFLARQAGDMLHRLFARSLPRSPTASDTFDGCPH